MSDPFYDSQLPDTPLRPVSRRPLLWGLAAGAVAVLLFGGVAAAVGVSVAERAGAPAGTSIAEPATTSTSTIDATAATEAQKVGVVTIMTNVYYGEGRAAGTGMILTADGTILTNNHVVEGSTKIEVTVESTGATYTADVVGTDPTADIAVLKLENASGLSRIKIADAALAVGDKVASVGNAEGTGDLVTAPGTVIAKAQSITVSDDLTGKPKPLTDLIETDADVVSGDSGGPLVNADGQVVGIVTAASSNPRDIRGYAIPVATALAVANAILSGDASDSVSLGLPAFLGITISDSSTSTAVIASTIDGLPAAQAGLGAGDTITSIDGATVTDYSSLTAIIRAHAPGDTITMSFTDAGGAPSTVTLTLVAGPAE